MPVTPLMSATLPTVGSTVGPTWANQLNNAINDVIDAHDHTPGHGARIPTNGININADLEMNSQDLTEARSVKFDNQGAVLAVSDDVRSLYAMSGNLHYNNNDGTAIKITDGTSLNSSLLGGFTGLAGTAGAATYSDSTKTFTYTQSTGVPAHSDAGNTTIRGTLNFTGSSNAAFDLKGTASASIHTETGRFHFSSSGGAHVDFSSSGNFSLYRMAFLQRGANATITATDGEIKTGGSEDLKINVASGRNVGIGVTPGTTGKLVVAGAGVFGSDGTQTPPTNGLFVSGAAVISGSVSTNQVLNPKSDLILSSSTNRIYLSGNTTLRGQHTIMTQTTYGLTISGSSAGTAGLQVRADPAQQASILLYDGATLHWAFGKQETNEFYLHNLPANKVMLRISASSYLALCETTGNVSLGSTTPSPTLKLDVAGNIGPHANDSYTLRTNALRFSSSFAGQHYATRAITTPVDNLDLVSCHAYNRILAIGSFHNALAVVDPNYSFNILSGTKTNTGVYNVKLNLECHTGSVIHVNIDRPSTVGVGFAYAEWVGVTGSASRNIQVTTWTTGGATADRDFQLSVIGRPATMP